MKLTIHPANQPTSCPTHQPINPPIYQHSPSQLWCPIWKSSGMLPTLGSLSDLFPSPIPGRKPLLVLFTAHVTLERADRLLCFSCWIVSHLSMEVSCLCLLQFCSELFQMYRMELNDRLCLGDRGKWMWDLPFTQGTHRRVALGV